MGQGQSAFLTPSIISKYEAATFLSESEIRRLYLAFKQLTSAKAGLNPLMKTLTQKEFELIPELENNPFKERISKVFSNDQGLIGFEDFLEFASVMSDEASKEVKAFFAFRMYDFNDDGSIDRQDVYQVIKCLLGQSGQNIPTSLSKKDIDYIAKKVMQEADLDGEGSLSFVEFEHVINRAPDFQINFCIPI